jgi:N4-gp56 family major capsid protein
MGNTTRTDIPAEVSNTYDRNLLMRAVPLLVHTKYGQVRDIPSNAGSDTVKFRRYTNLTAATTALSEGITPAGSSLSVTSITAQVQYYGDFVTLTDKLQYETEDPILTETSGLLGDQAGDTLDQLTRDVLNAGTNVLRVNARTGRTSIVSTDVIDAVTLRKAIRLLKNSKAKTITKMVDPSTGYATSPVAPSYLAIVHPNVTFTLQKIAGFVPVENYANKGSVLEGEVGKFESLRFIESTNAKVFTAGGFGSIDVYSTLIFGMEAYGTTRLSGKAMQNIVKPLGSAGSSDPLNQRATSGWKASFVAKILNDDYMVRVESAVES